MSPLTRGGIAEVSGKSMEWLKKRKKELYLRYGKADCYLKRVHIPSKYRIILYEQQNRFSIMYLI